MSQNLESISKSAQNGIPGTYIVTLQKSCDLESHLGMMQTEAHRHNPPSQFDVLNRFSRLNGYQAKLDGPVLGDLSKSNEVRSIVEDRSGTLDVLG
ncbi:peptidase inhibitor i9 [Ceratobasidium sp. AG-Ba]|nr:peptidase inhibitor i9 [Ceratobasidium sp. AG-Ba]QRV98609.1 peptidase inhibitor i9 [Ceratobasidium sp. AG-Ba]